MSRFSGAWVALKCIHDTVESTASVEVGPDRPSVPLPGDHVPPPGGLNFRAYPEQPWPPLALEVERLLHVHKLEAAKAFARANRVDRVVLGGAVGTGSRS